MFNQWVIVAGLLLVLLNLSLNLITMRKPRRDSPLPGQAPLVSVLIPARNEEANIASCLETLRQQDYPSFEIIVLDDGSIDGTYEVVSRIAATDRRIELLRGRPLPPDWAGKPFACYQLAQKARGAWLLFVDADTTHAPHMLRSTLALASELKVSMLSGFPHQLAGGFSQKTCIPVLYFIMLGWLPLWWLHSRPKPAPSLAIGQFLLFPRDAYWKFGGHAAVKARILEDVFIGMAVTSSGGRHIAVDLSETVFCDMYRDLGALWEGFIKWVYSVAALSPLALLGMMLAAYFLYLAPFYWLWRDLFLLPAPSIWRHAILLQVALVFFMRWMVDSKFKEPVISAPLHPLGLTFLFVAAFQATWRRIAGAGVCWKKRLYDNRSCVK